MVTPQGYLFKRLRNNYRPFIIHHVNRSIKLHLQLAALNANMKFLTFCKKNKVPPNGFRIKPPFRNAKTDAICNRAAIALMAQTVTFLHIRKAKITKAINYHHDIFSIHLKIKDHLDILNEIYRKVSRTKHTKDETHARKFGTLMATKYPIHVNEKAVHNLTDIPLNILQTNALSKIGKFAIPPPKTPKLEIIIATENCINRNYDKIADHNALRGIIARTINKNHHNFSNNLNPYEVKFLKQITNDDNICITTADKGGGVVLMTTTEYEEMAQLHLTDRSIYQPTTYSINLYQQRIVDNLEWACKHRKLATVYLRRGTITEPKFPTIRFLPKVHKEKTNNIFKARPIINCKKSPIQGISNIIFQVLRPFAEEIPHCSKNGMEILDQLKDIDFRNQQLHSLDIKAMYTSLTYSIIKPAIKMCLENNHERLMRKFDMLPEHVDFLIWVLITQQYFMHLGQHYKQIHGLFMGLAASGPIGDLTIAHIESRMFILMPHITYYTRYVDDTLIVCDRGDIDSIFKILNEASEEIEFELERGGRTINFLDLKIKLDNFNGLHTEVFRKPTTANRFIHYHSFTPRSHKLNTIDFMFRRAFRYCSSLAAFTNEVNFCINILTMHQYPYKTIIDRLKNINLQYNSTEKGLMKLKLPSRPKLIPDDLINLSADHLWDNVNLKTRRKYTIAVNESPANSPHHNHPNTTYSEVEETSNTSINSANSDSVGPTLTWDFSNEDIASDFWGFSQPPSSTSSSPMTSNNSEVCDSASSYDSNTTESSSLSNISNIQPVIKKCYAAFPYFPPLNQVLKKYLGPLGIIPSYSSTHKITANKPMKNPDHIVYHIPCHGCTRGYVGQTKFTLDKRVKEHIKAYEDMDKDRSAIVRHYLAEGHAPDFSEAHRLKRVENLRNREIAEAFFILDQCAHNSATVGRSVLHYFKLDKGVNNTGISSSLHPLPPQHRHHIPAEED